MRLKFIPVKFVSQLVIGEVKLVLVDSLMNVVVGLNIKNFVVQMTLWIIGWFTLMRY